MDIRNLRRNVKIMISCSKCGIELSEGLLFCPACGTPVGESVRQDRYIPDKGFKEIFFSTKGRLNRKRFIIRGLILGVAGNVLTVLIVSLLTALLDFDGMILSMIPASVLSIVMIFFGLTLNIRRCHDLGKSGWYVLAIFFIIPGLFLLFKKGTVGPNKYGPDPLENNLGI